MANFSASSGGYNLSRSIFAAASRYRFPCFDINAPSWCKRMAGELSGGCCAKKMLRCAQQDRPDGPSSHRESIDYFQTHVTGGAFDLAHGAFKIDGVEILHLNFGNFLHLGPGAFTDL